MQNFHLSPQQFFVTRTCVHVLTVQHNNFYMIYIQFSFKQLVPQDAFSCIYVRTFQKTLMVKTVKEYKLESFFWI